MSWLFGSNSVEKVTSPDPSKVLGTDAIAQAEEKLDQLEAGSVKNDTELDHYQGVSHFHLPTMKPELVGKQNFIPTKLAEEKMAEAMA